MTKYQLRLIPGDPGEPNYKKLGISDERVKELDSAVQYIANDTTIRANTDFLAKAIELAETFEEVVYLCYIIGMAINDAYRREQVAELLSQTLSKL